MSMSSSNFHFLPFQELEARLITLISKVYEKHKTDKTQISPTREAQLKLLTDIYDRLKKIANIEADREKLLAEIKEDLLTIENTLTELIKISEPNEELKVNIKNLIKKKQSLEKLIKTSLTSDIHLNITDEIQSKIFSSALLFIKNEIAKEYSGYLWGWRDPNHSSVYAGIDQAMGVTDENKLTVSDIKEILSLFHLHINSVELVRKFDIAKLKHLKDEQKRIRDPKFIYDLTANVVENGHGDLLLDTPEEKERYKRFVDSELAYYVFLNEISEDIKGAKILKDKNSMEENQETSKIKMDNLVVSPNFAKLPNGKIAKNKTIKDNEDPEHYMVGVEMNKPEDVWFNADQQKSFYKDKLAFFKNIETFSHAKLGHLTSKASKHQLEEQSKATKVKEEKTIRFTR